MTPCRSHNYMSEFNYSNSDEVEQLLRNLALRCELEPFYDESISRVSNHLSVPQENEYLASMLAWEKAPVLPIAQWFDPPLTLPRPENLDAESLRRVLMETIHKLHDKRVVLEHTGHLNDRQLYCLIGRDILPSPEKKLDNFSHYLKWSCIDPESDLETWLMHYASDEERDSYADAGMMIPNKSPVPFSRSLPTANP